MRGTADRRDKANQSLVDDHASRIHLSNKKHFHHTILNILTRSD